MAEEFTMIKGVFNANLWRDEANGKAFFVIVTKTPMVLKQMYSKTFISRNPLTNEDETWYEIKVNAFEKPIPAIERGTPVKIEGFYQDDEKDDSVWQFKLTSIDLSCDDEITAIRYLKKYGFEYNDALNMVKTFGCSVFSYTENDDFQGYLEKSLSKKKSEEIIKKLERTVSEVRTFNLFSEAKIAYPYVIKAVKHYGINAPKFIKTAPYSVGIKIGLTFRQCDELANKMGFSATSASRLKALTSSVMKSYSAGGNIYTPFDMFKKQASIRINSSIFSERISITSVSSIKDEEFDVKDRFIFSKALKKAEERAAFNIKRLAISKAEPYSEDYIPIIEGKCRMKFGREQLLAFKMFIDRGIKILTGGPGTGKTTTVKGLIMLYMFMHPDHKIKLAAPTGRAAQRLSESTGLPATTVHKLLNYVPYGDNPTCKDGNDPIDADFIVIDEASMIDIELFDMLLEAIKNDTTLLLVGDIHQLESVGPGAVLRDLLSAKTVNIKHTFLTEVFRQKGGSPIIDNSVKINKGITKLETSDDFQIIKLNNQTECFNKVNELYLSIFNPNDMYETQILCPTYKGEAGIDRLNVAIRDKINPTGKTLTYGFQKFRIGDKIIMTKNNMEVGYYNGDIGVITSIVDDRLTIAIKQNEIILTRENFDDMSLAYAITVHRSQGSEFKNVIVVLPKEPKSMLVKNLFYTAVTRAKKTVYIVTEKDAMETAILTDKTDDRRTRLSKLIQN